MTRPVGLLLAAGAGRRMGGPKALVESLDGTPWVVAAARALRDGGCDGVVVVIGAEHARVRAVLEMEPVTVAYARDWDTGMGASLRTGLSALVDRDDPADAALVQLVDLPDVGPDVVRRVLAASAPDVLARASYRGVPGHPVLLGRAHWAGVSAVAVGDRGAREYLLGEEVLEVDCSDLASGEDVDRPPGP